MCSPRSEQQRMNRDVSKLIEANHEVKYLGGLNNISVKFYGPNETPYKGGVWYVKVHLPEQYPFKSPSIGFTNRIFHPNIDEPSGVVCLDVMNEAWSPVFGLINIFESFLPQLLTYPNPKDPLNQEAACLFLNNPEQFNEKVQEYVRKYATEKESKNQESPSSEESSLSDFSEDETEGMEL